MHWLEQNTEEELRNEAITAFSREMGNSLMILQNGLDQLRDTHGDASQFEWMQEACHRASYVLHGSMGVIGNYLPVRENFWMGEFFETILPDLQEAVYYDLALRTHENCCINASKTGLIHCLHLLLQHVEQIPRYELYIEIYPSEPKDFQYGVLTLNIVGELTNKDTSWRLLKSMLLMHGVQLLEEPNEFGLRCHLMMEMASECNFEIPNRTSVESATAIIVENEPRIAELIANTLSAYGTQQVEVFNRPEAALEWLSHHSPSIVLVEYDLPGMSGIELLKKAKPALTNSVISLMCGHHIPNLEQEITALELSVQFLMKPFCGDDLSSIITRSQVAEEPPTEPIPAIPPNPEVEIPESLKNTMRLKRKPKNQQCPPGFTPDIA